MKLERKKTQSTLLSHFQRQKSLNSVDDRKKAQLQSKPQCVNKAGRMRRLKRQNSSSRSLFGSQSSLHPCDASPAQTPIGSTLSAQMMLGPKGRTGRMHFGSGIRHEGGPDVSLAGPSGDTPVDSLIQGDESSLTGLEELDGILGSMPLTQTFAPTQDVVEPSVIADFFI